jgi:Tfp pilus assembly protein PilX
MAPSPTASPTSAPAVAPARIATLAARRAQRGAVVFIVAMTLALLAIMGVYAISSSATEVRSAGYVRQATQAHYLSEYALGAVVNHVTSQNADYMVNTLLIAKTTATTTATSDCVSVPTYLTASPIARACMRFSQTEFENTWQGRPLLTEYSLGQAGNTTMQGTVFAELTNPTLTQPPPGFDQALGLSFARVTITTGGSVQAGGFDPTRLENRTLEMGRARIIVGPVKSR